MTNACLGFLLQELGKKCWELSLKRGAASWKPWVSGEKQTAASVTSFLWSKACPALHRKERGRNLQHPSPPGDSRAAGLSCSAQGSPDTIPGVGERDSSLSIPVTSSSSHTAGNYLGWDHQLGKQEKEMGTWWATPWSAATSVPHSSCVPMPVQAAFENPGCPNQDMLWGQL